MNCVISLFVSALFLLFFYSCEDINKMNNEKDSMCHKTILNQSVNLLSLIIQKHLWKVSTVQTILIVYKFINTECLHEQNVKDYYQM